MKHAHHGFALSLFFCTFIASAARGEIRASVEGLNLWQTVNDVQIPGDTGTRFSLTDFERQSFLGYRIYLGYRINKRHEIRALYAPLELERTAQFNKTVNFQGQSFAAGVNTEALYKFNSYRLTYAYHFEPSGNWRWALGFTGKIRDAEIRLRQGSTRAGKPNVGFVPLANIQAVWSFAPQWAFRMDFDGLAAPQGRALDLSLYLEREIGRIQEDQVVHLIAGYRTLEGGADNDEVYNFAWIHAALLGLRAEF